MTFIPQDHINKIQGKDYLEVKWRLVWFREDHPNGRIETEVITHDPVLMRAMVFSENNMLASGYGTAKKRGVSAARPYEGAETAAIGRALAHAGYGTQFTGEDEGDNLADSPVENGNGNSILEEDLPEVSYETAIGVENSKGVKYINLDNKALGGMVRSINQALLKAKTSEKIEELKFKKAAAICIMNHPNGVE